MATLRERKRKAAKRAALRAKAEEIRDVEMGAMNAQLKTFKENLEKFATQVFFFFWLCGCCGI